MGIKQIPLKRGVDKIKRNPDIWNIYGSSVSAEVQAIIDKMPNALAAGEVDKISAIVDPAVANGTWAQVDYLYCLALTDPDNALTSWVGTKTGTAVNSPTKVAGGFSFNGSTSYINTNINPSSDLTNAVLNDTRIEVYCKENRELNALRRLFGARDVSTNQIGILQNLTSNILQFYINEQSVGNTGTYFDGSFQDNTRYGLVRDQSNRTRLYVDGVENVNTPNASTALPGVPLFMGCQNQNGVASFFSDLTISYFIIGGGYNITNYNSMLDTLETQFSL